MVLLYFAPIGSENCDTLSINHGLVARAFPRSGQCSCFHSEFSLALKDIFLSSDLRLLLLWFRFFDTKSKSALSLNYLKFSPSVNVHRIFEFFFQSLASGSFSEKLTLGMIHLTPKRNQNHTNIKFSTDVSSSTLDFSLMIRRFPEKREKIFLP